MLSVAGILLMLAVGGNWVRASEIIVFSPLLRSEKKTPEIAGGARVYAGRRR
jgi:hypothetical protein